MLGLSPNSVRYSREKCFFMRAVGDIGGFGLSPRNPSFRLLDSQPIEVPLHSIIGDRGKGDTPDSSDGVVEYWSSQLKSAK